ncbi:hypothetical protein [Undibacterium macrobrachii]|uniref:Apea-like HEPN domain-containing protein n=1 Tax=Undibacterium macrobrachii TaxID=1119058 RepID=A0ABQ2XGH6_9BURK|nr:hypothetical protein [Undibacterium macrobrachii]GGX13669.1 hypothetical protein GCM10011282_19740 [Undibacterium macrobrachii]
MNTHNLSFGYYPQTLDVSAGAVSISTIPNLTDIVFAIEKDSEHVAGDWIYAPPQEVLQFGGNIVKMPYPTRIFGLPKTHILSHSSPDNDDHLRFHLWVLSFFVGMRLTSTEAGFIDSTPIKPNKLFDFVLTGQGIVDVLVLAEAFWAKHRTKSERAKLIAGIIHALFLSQNPHHLQFERFLLLYSAFDACFALAKSIQKPPEYLKHGQRISWMCKLFGMQIPAWADDSGVLSTEIASLRNESVHEALFMGEPLGFVLHGVGTGVNLTLEMEALACRLLIALLGSDKMDYVASPVTTRQQYAIRLM